MRYRLIFSVLFGLLACLFPNFSSSLSADTSPKPTHGISLHGDLKYPANFKHFDYVNPDAPKGGMMVRHGLGTFDSLNPFIIKGHPASGMTYLHPSLFYASLMTRSSDEPFSEYGSIAEKVELADDNLSLTYTLRKGATFHDGSPIRPEDVIFSFNTAMEKGNPLYKAYYNDVIKIEKVGGHGVKFTFRTAENKELPVILGEMPIFSEKWYTTHDFTKPSLEIPPGSGPYKIIAVEPGRSLTYERVKNWWGAKLPVNVGRYNPDRIKFIYFRDPEVAFEGFKSGTYDFRAEFSAKNWAQRYDFPSFEKGDVVRKEWERPLYFGMIMLSFNIRRNKFKDPRVRHALALMYDFEWTNKNVLYSMYKVRPMSYFSGGELAALEPPTEAELKILEPYRKELPKEVFTKAFSLPKTKGDGNIRPLIREAKALLKEAGYVIKSGKMVSQKTGKPLTFEILTVSGSQEKWFNGFIRNLEEIGVHARIKIVESAQYIRLLNEFNYDMVADRSLQSPSPGNEQREMWGSKAAKIPGSDNLIGIESKVVDELIEKLIKAQTRQDLINHVKALDRVLQWGYYTVPLMHHEFTRVAYWRVLKHPKTIPFYHLDLMAWWIDKETALALAEIRDTMYAANASQTKLGPTSTKIDSASLKESYFSPSRIAIYTILLIILGLVIRWYRHKKSNRK